MTERLHTLMSSLLQHTIHSINTFVQVLDRGPEGETDIVMTRRVEEVTTMSGVDIEEDARDDNSLFLQKFFEEGLERNKYARRSLFR